MELDGQRGVLWRALEQRLHLGHAGIGNTDKEVGPKLADGLLDGGVDLLWLTDVCGDAVN